MIRPRPTTNPGAFYTLPFRPIPAGNHYNFFQLGFPLNYLPFNYEVRRETVSTDSSGFMRCYSPGTSWICCFSERHRKPEKTKMSSKKKKIEIEIEDAPVGCGEDVLDADMAKVRVSPEHLVVMVNGLMGSAADWKFAAQQFVNRIPEKIVVHCSECNYAKLTMDGVDLMGERLADELLSVVGRMPGLQKISFVAHSLGGLVARYAIGKLYEPPGQSKSKAGEVNCLDKNCQGEMCMARIAGLEPVNFITVATPHLGSRGHKQLPFLCGFPFLERQASQTAHLIAGRSGKHLFLTDSDDDKLPLLLRMVTDSYDYKFISALHSFKRRVAYANANYDYVVGWRTSSIRRPHELPEVNRFMKNDKYPHIVYVEPENLEGSHYQASSYAQDQKVDYEEEMIRGLRQVPWERVDVSFHKSRQRYVAHNTIQVKNYWLNSDGVGVISHMIDNFIL